MRPAFGGVSVDRIIDAGAMHDLWNVLAQAGTDNPARPLASARDAVFRRYAPMTLATSQGRGSWPVGSADVEFGWRLSRAGLAAVGQRRFRRMVLRRDRITAALPAGGERRRPSRDPRHPAGIPSPRTTGRRVRASHPGRTVPPALSGPRRRGHVRGGIRSAGGDLTGSGNVLHVGDSTLPPPTGHRWRGAPCAVGPDRVS